MARCVNVGRCFALLLVVAVAGCGGGGGSDQPDLGTVSGVVKLDGEPLANANVEFQPEEGRPSTATTNDDGEYELKYTFETKGAKIGTHKVMIWTFQEGDSDDGTPTVLVEEKVPVVYNRDTTLEETVEAGSQEIDFELDSSLGEIVQKPPY